MHYFIARIPSRFVVGAPTILPVIYTDEVRARNEARAKVTAPNNIVARINDTLHIHCYYVVVSAHSQDEALRRVNTEERFANLRNERHPTTYAED